MSEFNIGGVFKGALAGGVAAGALNTALYLAGGAAGAKYMMMPPGQAELAPIPVVMPFVLSVLPALIGAGIFAGLLKFVPAMAWKIFLAVTAVGFLFMFPGPIMQFTGDTAAIATLELMHVVVVAGVLSGISRLGRG